MYTHFPSVFVVVFEQVFVHGILLIKFTHFPADIYLLKLNNRNTKRCEQYSELPIKTSERRQ